VGIIIHLLAMQWAAAAFGLSHVWRGHPSKKLRVILVACVPIFYTISVSALVSFEPSLNPAARMLIVQFIILSLLFWLIWFWRVINPKPASPARGSGRQRLNGMKEGTNRQVLFWGGVAVQIMNLSLSALILGHWFTAHDAFHPISLRNLSILIGMGEMSASFLLFSATNGILAEEMKPADRSNPEPIRLFRAIQWLQSAIVVRGLAIAASLGVGAYSNPFGGHYFFYRLFGTALTMVNIRIVLGLILPTLFVWLALAALRHPDRQQTTGQFIPIFIIILIGEILAAGLTLGTYGIAF
jgi:hypothetical protein